jgi:hypothetical protein
LLSNPGDATRNDGFRFVIAAETGCDTIADKLELGCDPGAHTDGKGGTVSECVAHFLQAAGCGNNEATVPPSLALGPLSREPTRDFTKQVTSR